MLCGKTLVPGRIFPAGAGCPTGDGCKATRGAEAPLVRSSDDGGTAELRIWWSSVPAMTLLPGYHPDGLPQEFIDDAVHRPTRVSRPSAAKRDLGCTSQRPRAASQRSASIAALHPIP